jgi:CBS domain-containing protein
LKWLLLLVWLSIGSQGRKEQLLLTDQDSILVFEDVATEKYREVKDYFLNLGKKTTLTLEQIGYEFLTDIWQVTCCGVNH